MFTGIILAVGKITQIEQKSGDVRLSVNTGDLSLTDAHLGDSIAVNGICLTAVELSESAFVADVSNETLARTNLKAAVAGTAVNLELALTPQTRLGGHIVSGHVDGLATLVNQTDDGRSIRFKFKVENSLAKYIAEKGFNSPKKTYIVFTNFKATPDNSSAHGLPNSIIYGPAMFGYGEPTTTMISLKTYMQAQGAAYACGKGAHKKKDLHTKGSDILKSNDSSKKIDSKNNTYYRHNIEGKDDMPAHIKSALTNSHLTLSVKNSRIILGTWQGLYLFEHRLENQSRIISHHFIG